MIDELRKLRELTETLTGNGYLRDQAAEWEYALDAVPDYIYIINTKFEIKFTNRALIEKLNMNKQDVYGKLCYEIIFDNNDDVPNEWQNYAQIKLKPHVSEVFLNKLCGWYDITKSPIYTKTNKLIGFICVLQDVTAKKKALESLEASERTCRIMLDNVSSVIWTVDLDLNFTFVNSAITGITGEEPEDWIGRNVADYIDKKSFTEIYKYAKAAIRLKDFENHIFYTTFIKKDKEEIPVEITARPIKGERGDIVGFQGTTRRI